MADRNAARVPSEPKQSITDSRVLGDPKHGSTGQQISGPVLTQYVSIMSRAYVGSIHAELRDAELATLFCQFGGIKNINLAYDGGATVHKGYGFIEFEGPEAAALAIDKMEGVVVAGRGLKLGRPSSYAAELHALVPAPPPARIYVANIHEYVTADDLAELCGVFGAVRTLCLVADAATGRHKGYCYVEYEEERAAKRAVAHLDGLQLAGFTLHATRVATGMPLPPGVGHVSRRHAPSATPTARPEEHQAGRTERGRRRHPLVSLGDSPVVILKGVAYQHELDEQFEPDIKAEMARFGSVQTMHIATDDRPESANAVHVFVCYDYVSSADAAVHQMNGRWYGGRRIEASKYPLIRYQIKDFYC